MPDRYLSPEEVTYLSNRCEELKQELQCMGQTVLIAAYLLEEDGVTTAVVGCLKDYPANDLAVYLLTKGHSSKGLPVEELITLAKSAKKLYENLTAEVIAC